MTRAIDDKTSTCGTCSYFAADAPDCGVPDGHCQWLSLPAYIQRQHPGITFTTYMYATDGKDCWLHTKRTADTGAEHAD